MELHFFANKEFRLLEEEREAFIIVYYCLEIMNKKK